MDTCSIPVELIQDIKCIMCIIYDVVLISVVMHPNSFVFHSGRLMLVNQCLAAETSLYDTIYILAPIIQYNM